MGRRYQRGSASETVLLTFGGRSRTVRGVWRRSWALGLSTRGVRHAGTVCSDPRANPFEYDAKNKTFPTFPLVCTLFHRKVRIAVLRFADPLLKIVFILGSLEIHFFEGSVRIPLQNTKGSKQNDEVFEKFPQLKQLFSKCRGRMNLSDGVLESP